VSAIYTGPQCPLCDAPLDADSLRSGPMSCPSCSRAFEGTPFRPRELRPETVQAVTQTPDGVAAACANHSGNAAVTSCQRCGLFICSLCDMNTGFGSYCPSCFERMRSGGAESVERSRDYANMAILGSIIGLLCMISFLPFIPPFVIYWGIKGIKQRRAEGLNPAGVIAALILGILETAAIIIVVGMLLVSLVNKA
jgi:uncharacterized paraquat-inducible protein A